MICIIVVDEDLQRSYHIRCMSIKPVQVRKTQVARFKFLGSLSADGQYTRCLELVSKLRSGASPVEDYVPRAELAWAVWKWDSSLLPPKVDLPALFRYINRGSWLGSERNHAEWEQVMLALGMVLRDIHRSHFVNGPALDPTSWRATGHIAEDTNTFLDVRLALRRISSAIQQFIDKAASKPSDGLSNGM